MRTKTILTALILILINALQAQKTVDLRLNPISLDQTTQTLYVDVELRYNESGQLNLAGQNFRLYYNAEALHLQAKGSSSKLPKQQYSDLNIVDQFEGSEADEVNQLNFDDNLGFVNVSIDLKANESGGIVIRQSDNWVAVARLQFEVKESQDDYEVVWGRDGKTDAYATAFVEVSEWIEPYNIKSVNIEYVEDLAIDNGTEKIISLPTIAIGPNPATQYVQITLDQAMTENAEITIRDVSGRALKNTTIRKGQTHVRMDLTDMAAASYFLEVYSEVTGSVHHEKIVITK